MRALALIMSMAVAGCVSAPDLPPGEKFSVSCRRAEAPKEKEECLVKVRAEFDPPFPDAPSLHASAQLVEGVVTLEVKGWKNKGEPRSAEARVGVRPGIPFKVAVLYLGHRDEYTIVVPLEGDPTIEPERGEFTTRDLSR